MSKKRKVQWSRVIDVDGISIRLYERTQGTTIYMSFPWDGKKVQRSTKRRDRREAEEYARRFVHGLVEDRFLGRSGPVTLGEVFRVYRVHRVALLSGSWRQAAEMRIALFEEAWGTRLRVDDIGQTQVDQFAHKRSTGELAPKHDRSRKAVRAGTINSDFQWLSSVFNWARKHKVDGRRLLQDNPLQDVDWATEQNVRRPIASHERYTKTLERVDTVDPEGRLRCILTLARHTGRRENAICQLLASDVLRTQDDVEVVLSALGLDERQAQYFPHGGIRWRAETDKTGRYTVTPIRQGVREAIDTYLRKSPRVGDVPLFPSPKDNSKPIRRDLTARWLLKAEKFAGLPKLAGGQFHPYRRLWATERKDLPVQDVAAAGGWKTVETLQRLYQQADGATTLAAVQAGQ